jgi:hypothetical protein
MYSELLQCELQTANCYNVTKLSALSSDACLHGFGFVEL